MDENKNKYLIIATPGCWRSSYKGNLQALLYKQFDGDCFLLTKKPVAMTKLQIAKVAMLGKVQKVLMNNKSAWENIQPIATEVAELEPLMAAITANTATQFQTQTSGYTNQKDVAMEQMNSLGYKIGQRLASWARKNGNKVVLKAVDFSKTGMEHGTETEQISRNVSIVNAATDNMAAIADYKVDAANTATLQAAIDNAKLLIVTRDTVGSTGTVATANIDVTVKKAVNIVTTLDPMMESMLEEEDKLVEDLYFAARKVEHHRGGNAKPDEPTPSPSA